jgi:uncharacterized membrane protein
MLESGRPIYVEFRGTATGNGLKATQFVRANGTLNSCATAGTSLPTGTRLWAGGQEPNWQLVVGPREARLERPGGKPVRFPAAPFAPAGKPETNRTIDAWSAADGGPVRVELSDQMCTDGSSEAAYGTRATLRYGIAAYELCRAVLTSGMPRAPLDPCFMRAPAGRPSGSSLALHRSPGRLC